MGARGVGKSTAIISALKDEAPVLISINAQTTDEVKKFMLSDLGVKYQHGLTPVIVVDLDERWTSEEVQRLRSFGPIRS